MEFFTYIAKSAGILTLFYGVYLLVLRSDTFFTANRTYLLMGIISAIVLPFITITTTTFVEAPIVETIIPITTFETTTTEIIPIETSSFDWLQLLFWGYLSGLSIMLIHFSVQFFSLLKVLRKYPSRANGAFRLIEIEDAIAPFSFFNYIVYNPNTHDTEELQMILKHEKVHASQWHSIDLLLANLVRALQWANPISWFYKSSLEANLEFLADSATADQVPSKTEYQLVLLKASSSLPVPALTNNFYHSFIKKRIIMLNKSNSNKYNKLKLSLVLPALALFLYSFNTEEIIEYTTPISETKAVPETTLTKDTSVLSFSATSTDAHLDKLEAYFKDEHPESLIKISNRDRDAQGKLTNFSFQTKFSGNDRFYTRFDRGTKAPFKTVYEISSIEEGALLVKEIGKDGMHFKITEADLEFFDSKIELFNPNTKSIQEKGANKRRIRVTDDNPLYIINGKEYRKEELPSDKTIELDGHVELFNTEEGEKRYGDKGKEGVLLFNGNATFVPQTAENSKDEVIKKSTNPSASVAAATPKNSLVANKTVAYPTKEIRIKITKNTTKEELDKHKTELKREHGIDFDYKNVNFNNKNEITAIEISYKGKGMSGNYSVRDDEGEGINDFYFYLDPEEGQSGFASGSTDSRMKMREKMLAERNELRRNVQEKRKKLRGNISEQRSEEMENRRNEMAKIREEMRVERQEMRERVAEMREKQEDIIEEEERVVARGYTQTARAKAKGNSETVVINKDTTDEELALMKSKMQSKGFTFKYSRVKRNARGEITRIRIESNNGKGSKQSITTNTHGGDPIDPIVIDL